MIGWTLLGEADCVSSCGHRQRFLLVPHIDGEMGISRRSWATGMSDLPPAGYSPEPVGSLGVCPMAWRSLSQT